MKVKVYSWIPNQPCLYIQFDDCNILLDSGLSTSSMNLFMPLQEFTNYSPDIFPIPHVKDKTYPFVKVLEKQAFVTSKPLFHPIMPPEFVIRSLDAVLISNIESFIALPYLVRVGTFRGTIYATEAVIEFGKLVMNDMLTYYERAEKVRVNMDEDEDNEESPWRKYKFWMDFLNKPFTNPKEWRDMYSKLCIETTIARVTPIYLNSKVSINNSIEVIPTPSGFHIGSCNWVILNGNEKLSYITNSSVTRTHNQCMDLEMHSQADILLLNGINPNPHYNFNATISTIKSIVFQTLTDGGTVLFPVVSVSLLLELIINVAQVLRHAVNFRELSIVYVAPNARSTIAYASRFPEHLTSIRKSKCETPEDPFELNDLMDSNRLKVYDGFTDVLAEELKSSSIIIAGHPSLRMGDIIHFMYMFGSDPRNSIVQVEPDYPFENLFGPFQKFNIKSFVCPLDYTLCENFVNEKFFELINPKKILIPDIYNPDLALQYSKIKYNDKVEYYRYGDIMNIKCDRKFKDVLCSEATISMVNLNGDGKGNNLYSLKGYLNATDNKIVVSSEDSRRSYKPLTKTPVYGNIDIKQFLKEIDNEKIDYETKDIGEEYSSATVILTKQPNTSIHINNRIKKTRVICDDSVLKEKLIKILTKLLNTF
uniref:Beta-Casp domain-containing protein n=1 Tax=Parastrongyloides trichosuri TaxID=131310 RepID=A0A0N5A1R5_PARTI